MKKTLLLFVATLATTFTNAQTVGDTFTVDNINYSVTAVGTPNTAQVESTPGYASANLVIPATVSNGGNDFTITNIIPGAFAENPNIVNLTIEAVNCNIGLQAFRKCALLETITSTTLETGVIGNKAFWECPELISIDLPNFAGTSGNDLCLASVKLQSANLPKITTVNNASFNGCTALTSVNLSALTSVGNGTFNGASSLVTIDLPVLATIGSNVFANCTALKNLNIPVLTNINAGTFTNTGLETLNIPATVTTISGSDTFQSPLLNTINMNIATPIDITGLESMFTGANGGSPMALNIPIGSLSAYQAAAVWSDTAIFTLAESTLSVETVKAELGWNLYPNPAQEVVFLKNNQSVDASVNVIDLNGRILINKKVNTVESKINISSLSAGIYLFKVETEVGAFVRRILKQ